MSPTYCHVSTVRTRAARAIGRLAALSPRVDALLSDLLNSLQAATSAADKDASKTREAALAAVRGVVRFGGKAVSQPALQRASESLQGVLFEGGEGEAVEETSERRVAARALGSVVQVRGGIRQRGQRDGRGGGREGRQWDTSRNPRLRLAQE